MTYRPEQWEQDADALRRYPDPDWNQPGHVAVIGLAGDAPVGYLIRQGEALSWLTAEGATRGWAYGIRLQVEELIQGELDAGHDSADAWAKVTATVPLVEVSYEDAPLHELTDALRRDWKL